MVNLTLFEADDSIPKLVDLGEAVVAILARKGPEKALNEDSAAVIACAGGHVLIVADGMGGHNSGERASRIAIESIATRLKNASPEEPIRHAVMDGIEAANKAVLGLGIGAGTTLVAVQVVGGVARTFHVGDAASIHVGQRGRVKRRTLDHSPTAYAVEAGLLDESDALHHGERHLVTNYVGTELMRVEVGPPVVVARHDTIMLASDGVLDNMAAEDVIEEIRRGDLLESATELADRVRKRMVDPEPGAPSKPDDTTLILYRRSC